MSHKASVCTRMSKQRLLLCLRLRSESFLKPFQSDGIAAFEELAHPSGLLAEAQADSPHPSGFLTVRLEIDDGPHVRNRGRERKSLRCLRDSERHYLHRLVAENRVHNGLGTSSAPL